ncbi:tumor necrosis factor receptor superfamily member 14-like isoform X2 [Anguilla rostrata]|uniref:tumor necrosis factor receptor superfamily member 14-like isoform X2 n=1 Tax=Anguilla rostrata TaxID=7938 RepID=UPI0030D06048
MDTYQLDGTECGTVGICFQRKLNMWHFKVPLWMAYLLLLFCGLAYSCGSAEYEINGECCPMCTPGTRVYKHCTEYTSTSCAPCTQKSFIPVPNGLSHCLPCIVCDQDLGLKTERECTPTSDTVCGPLDHHYCTKTDNKGCSFAQKHTICRPGQFIIHKGTTSTNTECGYCLDKTFSNESFSAYCKPHRDCQSLGLQEITAGTTTSDSECGPRNILVYIVILCLVFVLLVPAVILAIIFILSKFLPLSERRKKKATDLTERERMNSTSQPQDEGSRSQNVATDLTEHERMNRTRQPQDEGSRGQNMVCEKRFYIMRLIFLKPFKNTYLL